MLHRMILQRDEQSHKIILWEQHYSIPTLSRGRAVWQLVGLITRRSQVQILSPQPKSSITYVEFTSVLIEKGSAFECNQSWSGSSVG